MYSFVLFFCCFVLFCFVLFCFVLFCFVLFCFVLFCFVLFCFVLFCFVLFCFVRNATPPLGGGGISNLVVTNSKGRSCKPGAGYRNLFLTSGQKFLLTPPPHTHTHHQKLGWGGAIATLTPMLHCP